MLIRILIYFRFRTHFYVHGRRLLLFGNLRRQRLQKVLQNADDFEDVSQLKEKKLDYIRVL